MQAALLRHLALAGAALLLALVIAVPLAWAGSAGRARRGRWARHSARYRWCRRSPCSPPLIPLLALLLAAVPALRGLGLGAIGPAPAVLATAGYLALPLWRSLLGGLAAADPAAVAAARPWA